jgi:hypothetical protein
VRGSRAGDGNPEEALSWNRLLATLLMLALGACAQVAGQGQAPYAPYTHDDSDIRNGSDGGGGGGM